MQSDSIAKLQRKTSIHRRTSVKTDEKEFKGRSQDSEWKDSSKINNCSLCSKAFTLTFRKHHCRECGGVFCGPCSAYKVVINATLKRSCLSCYKKLIGGSDAQSLVLNNNQAPVDRRTDGGSADTKRTSTVELEEPTNDLPTWIDALLFCRKIGSDNTTSITNSVKAAFPEDSLSPAMVDDILATALSKPMKGTKLKELKFMFRVRDKQLTSQSGGGTASTGTGGEMEEINKTTVFYNCYVFYRQEFYGDKAAHSKKDTAGVDAVTFGTASDAKLMRQAIVVVSKWPFPQLAFRLLSKLDDGLVWNSDPAVNNSLGATSVSGWKEFPADDARGSEGSDGELAEKPSMSAPGSVMVGGTDLNAVNSVFMTGYAQIAVWPRPKPGTQMYLHFLGELLQYSVAHDVISTYGANLSLATAFASMNLVTMLGPLGLLQHVWVLWELLVTGQDIVVMAATPTQAAEVVLLLASLTLPLAHAGDVRPYMHPDDSDLAILAATAKRKRIQQASVAPSKEVGTNAMIVGVCDPAALEKLSSFSAALLLTPQGYGAVADPDAVFKGLRQKNAAQCVQLDQRGYSALGMVGKVVTKKPDSGWVTFVDYFNGWLDNNATVGPANSKPLIVCKIEPSALTIKRTLTKIKNMHPKDRNILGDKLVRDNLKELTVAFFKNNNTEGQSIEAANLQQTAQLRAVALTEAQKQAVAEARAAKGTIAIILEDMFVGFHKSLPWVSKNVPTIFLWVSYALLLLVTRLSGLPTVLLIGAALVVKIPTKAPVAFEKSLQKFLPDWILYPQLGGPQESELDEAALSARAAAAAQASADAARNPRVGRGKKAGRLDFSGVWKRVKLENYENFLAAQGASYIQRNIAVSLPLVHTITMSKDWMAFNITEKGGPINSTSDIVIGGPPVATQLAKTTFLDTATWDNGKLKVVKLKTPDKSCELITHRWLEDNGNTIHISLTHVDFKNGNKETTAHSWFAYQGPSTNEVPASVNPADEADEPDDLPVAAAAAAPKGAAAGNARIGTGKKAGRLELSGAWKRVKVENYENFLGAQGANFMQRKLASSLPLVHTFTMSKDLMVYNLTEKGGPIDSNSDFVVGGPAVTTQLAKTQFEDTVTWEDGKLKVVKLKLPEKNYELVTHRWLEDNGNTIHCSLTHVDFKNGNKETTAHSWFAYQGPSTAERPASLNPADEIEDAPEAAAAGDSAAPAAIEEIVTGAGAAATRKDLSGVWNRTKSVNFEAVIGATGAGFMQRKIAASMALCHTITLDKSMQAIRLQEKGGPINIDFSLTIGNPNAVPYDNNGKKLTHRAYWEGEALVMHRVVLEGNYELINRRTLDESTDVKQLVCSIKFHDLRSGNEVEATSWFSYAGPSPTPQPVPDLSVLPKVAEAPAPVPEKVEQDLDDDEDTDEVAVAKMRMSVAIPSSAAARLFQPAGVATFSHSPVGGAASPLDRMPNLTGVWHRDMGQAQGLAAKFHLTHTIKQDATTFMLREQDNGGRVLEDLTLVIGGPAIEKLYPQQRRLKCSCYWEGATLVVQQVNTAESFELVMRRNLEEHGQQLRLTVIHRSLTTGEESESMSIFNLAAKKM